MTAADYQREKDGYPDVEVCPDCGLILEQDDTTLCVTCERLMIAEGGAEES